MGKGVPSQLTGGLEECRKLPQWGPRQSPGRKRFSVNLKATKRIWWHGF